MRIPPEVAFVRRPRKTGIKSNIADIHMHILLGVDLGIVYSEISRPASVKALAANLETPVFVE